MHVLVAVAVLVGLVAYAFGEKAARVFTAAILGLAALAVCGIIFIAAVDMHRQEVAARPTVLHLEATR